MNQSFCSVSLACLAIGVALIPAHSVAQSPPMPAVTYQNDDYNEINTYAKRLRAIMLRSNVKASTEAAMRQILPQVLGCNPVQEKTDGANEFFTLCVPKSSTNFAALGLILAQFDKTEGYESIRHDIYLFDPKFPEANLTRARYDEIVEMRPPPRRARVDLVGGAYLDGYEIGSRRIDGTPGATVYQIAIAPHHEWVGGAAICGVTARPSEKITDTAFRDFFGVAMQQMRSQGSTVTSRGDTVSPVWKSASAIGQSIKNGQPHQSYYRVIHWSSGGKFSGLEVFCELTADPKVRKIAEMVEKRLLVVHSGLDH